MTSIELTEKWSEVGWSGIAAFLSLLQDQSQEMRVRIWRFVLIKGFSFRPDDGSDPFVFFETLWERREDAKSINALSYLDAACKEAVRVWYKRDEKH